MRNDLERFYALIAQLEKLPGQGTSLTHRTGRSGWPSRGVYFFREPGEVRRSDPGVHRVVRVGTHALTVGRKSSLWSRLRAHRGGSDGRGNHRGSVFRLHVGAALLARDGQALESWGRGSAESRAVRDGEVEHERRVSAHIGSMSVLWVAVPDEPGPLSLRARIERNAIALLSNRLQPEDEPSERWLGRYSPRGAIRESGLWNVNHVEESYTPEFLGDLESLIAAMAAAR
jgi:hypothetical protein